MYSMTFQAGAVLLCLVELTFDWFLPRLYWQMLLFYLSTYLLDAFNFFASQAFNIDPPKLRHPLPPPSAPAFERVHQYSLATTCTVNSGRLCFQGQCRQRQKTTTTRKFTTTKRFSGSQEERQLTENWPFCCIFIAYIKQQRFKNQIKKNMLLGFIMGVYNHRPQFHYVPLFFNIGCHVFKEKKYASVRTIA
jgi:hypothetical protein